MIGVMNKRLAGSATSASVCFFGKKKMNGHAGSWLWHEGISSNYKKWNLEAISKNEESLAIDFSDYLVLKVIELEKECQEIYDKERKLNKMLLSLVSFWAILR
jgi:hypothetical protein